MSSRYLNISQIKTDQGKTIYSQSYYPKVPLRSTDIYIITKSTDRFDLISLDFWGDKAYWWVIPVINNIECDSMFPPAGIQLRIPSTIGEVLDLYNEENI
jgi:hypothetical protein